MSITNETPDNSHLVNHTAQHEAEGSGAAPGLNTLLRTDSASDQASLVRIETSISDIAVAVKNLAGTERMPTQRSSAPMQDTSRTQGIRIGDERSRDEDISDDGLKNKSLATTSNDKSKEGEDVQTRSREFPDTVIAKIRECATIDEFKTFTDRYHGRYVLETLQLTESDKSSATSKFDTIKGDPQDHSHPTKYATVDRIRINSRAILNELSKLSPGAGDLCRNPVTFLRPFPYLIYCQARMKQLLDGVPSSQGIGPPLGQTIETQKHEADNESNSSQTDSKLGEQMNSVCDQTLEQIRCYVTFVDERIMPLYNSYRPGSHVLPKEIACSDISYLFEPGDLVYITGTQTTRKKGHIGSSSSNQSEPEQRVWRVVTGPQRPNIQAKDAKKRSGPDNAKIECYYIDYDGDSYGAVSRTVEIELAWNDNDRFSTMNILNLPVYPIHFAKDWQKLLQSSKMHGQDFKDWLRPANRYSFYNGWTLTRSPSGEEIEVVEDGDTKTATPEHIESTVMIDYMEAFNRNPSWKPEFRNELSSFHEMSMGTLTFDPLLQYSDHTKTKLTAKWIDLFVSDEDLESLQISEVLAHDKFINEYPEGSDPPEPEDDDLVLLPQRMFAYAMWDRKFVVISVGGLKPKEDNTDTDSFEQLRIPDEYKLMVQALVKGHFDRKQDDERHSFGIFGQDLIRGKGKGVVILLHGVPGVGKSATAEAVAERFRRPLFPITCGDLGSTAKEVERNINGIFRLAHLWDCVLLLDEADIFISQRDKDDLNRNALVSVFLRMLEYYNGVLFLTTNRPGVLDEAIKSRVHLSLRYKPLDWPQTKAIFELNIERLKKIEDQRKQARPEHVKLSIETQEILDFAKSHFHRHQSGEGEGHSAIGRWNGRQIRNAFLMAASLAHFKGDEARKTYPDDPKSLKQSHFQTVEETTEHYDRYRMRLLNADDDTLAFQANTRLPDHMETAPRSTHGQRDDRASMHSIPNQETGSPYRHFGARDQALQYRHGPVQHQQYATPPRSEASIYARGNSPLYAPARPSQQHTSTDRPTDRPGIGYGPRDPYNDVDARRDNVS